MHYILTSMIAVAAIGLACDSASALPAMPLAAAPDSMMTRVLCKYGTPHCVKGSSRPKLPTAGTAGFPDSGWIDPDCKYYGNCGVGTPTAGNPTGWGEPSIARRGPPKQRISGSQPGPKSRR